MTREEAIKRLYELEFYCASEADAGENGSGIWQDDINALDMAISALREQPRWISVTDRLPSHPNKVLVYTKSGKYSVAKYIERMGCFISAGQLTVTHWAELPEPPEVDA